MIKMDTTLVQENADKLDSYFVQKQVEILINMNNSKIMSEIAKLNSAVESLKEELNDVRQYAKNLVRQAEGSALPPQQNNNVRAEQPSAQNSSYYNQRCGNHTPEDVSVFKFFYAGKK